MARRANVKKTVVLSHLSARADGGDDYTSWVEEVKMHLPAQVLVAKDLMEFDHLPRDARSSHTQGAADVAPSGQLPPSRQGARYGESNTVTGHGSQLQT